MGLSFPPALLEITVVNSKTEVDQCPPASIRHGIRCDRAVFAPVTCARGSGGRKSDGKAGGERRLSLAVRFEEEKDEFALESDMWIDGGTGAGGRGTHHVLLVLLPRDEPRVGLHEHARRRRRRRLLLLHRRRSMRSLDGSVTRHNQGTSSRNSS